MSIGNVHSLPVTNSDREISVPETGAVFHAYARVMAPSINTLFDFLSLLKIQSPPFKNLLNLSTSMAS